MYYIENKRISYVRVVQPGWTANTAATNALRQKAPAICRSARKSAITVAMWTVGGVEGEGPADALERQTPGDHRIIIHIFIVIEVNKPVMQRLPEDGKSNRG
jgi:hypothetical protein